ncbi:hypothetical protein MAH1_00890 [Sessilibacter sp. MAH1]
MRYFEGVVIAVMVLSSSLFYLIENTNFRWQVTLMDVTIEVSNQFHSPAQDTISLAVQADQLASSFLLPPANPTKIGNPF